MGSLREGGFLDCMYEKGFVWDAKYIQMLGCSNVGSLILLMRWGFVEDK